MAVERRADEDGRQGGGPSLSERLLAVLTREMAALEKELIPRYGEGEAGAEAVGAGPPGGAKGRIEAVGQMTRTLEKLLELRRLEVLEARGEGEEDGEAARLRAEMLKRLKALDARRKAGASLFAPEESLEGRAAGMAPTDGAGAGAGAVETKSGADEAGAECGAEEARASTDVEQAAA